MTEPPTPPALKPFLLELLAAEHRTCPACRGDLHQLASDACPHCRAPLTVGLAARDVYRAAWEILLTILFIDASIGAFFGIIALRAGAGQLHVELWPSFIMFMISIPGPILLLRLRTRFFRLPTLVQWILLSLCGLYSLAALVLFVLAIHR